MTTCTDCTGGSERCASEGHLRSVDLSTGGDYCAGMRTWLCYRCGGHFMTSAKEELAVANCDHCGKAVPA